MAKARSIKTRWVNGRNGIRDHDTAAGAGRVGGNGNPGVEIARCLGDVILARTAIQANLDRWGSPEDLQLRRKRFEAHRVDHGVRAVDTSENNVGGRGLDTHGAVGGV